MKSSSHCCGKSPSLYKPSAAAKVNSMASALTVLSFERVTQGIAAQWERFLGSVVYPVMVKNRGFNEMEKGGGNSIQMIS